MSFPILTSGDILAFQFSAWYPVFSSITIKSTVIRPLPKNFQEYLHSEGVFVPDGADDVPFESTLSDDEDEASDEEETPRRKFAFPELDDQIRECVRMYGALFPKLNFSSPQDASWVLPASSPLKCTSPADVYLLLKSSDFITHDITPESVFDGCSETPAQYELELVLRKWYPVDRSREIRCFVRENALIGISQRDTNYYEFLNDPATQSKIASSVQEFWESNIRAKWHGPNDYIFDLLLTRDLARGHILDFNPYAPRTDSLLFTYDELHALNRHAPAPELRVIDSRAHPAATSNAPAHQHNMVPFEALSLSSGRDIEEFADVWREENRLAG
ncbi:D123-domain-containing protein [Mycena amicta]|nr:D123-domain-containing protein [Mycena amicta]